MNGIRLFLDTNAIISLLKENRQLIELCAGAHWIGTSSINVIEFLSFPGLTFDDAFIFAAFLERIEVVGVGNNTSFLEDLAAFKKESKLKLPDAIIAGYAIQHNASLVTNDRHFEGVRKLNVLKFDLP